MAMGLTESWARMCHEKGISFATFKTTSESACRFIDHCFTDMGLGTLIRAYLPMDWEISNDHVPLISEIAIPILPGKRHRRPPQHRPFRMDVSTEAKQRAYREALAQECTQFLNQTELVKAQTTDEAQHQLEFLSRKLHNLAKSTQDKLAPPKRRRKRRVGEGTESQAACMHIRFLLELHEIHSRSRTRHKKKKITPPMRAGRLKRMFTYWATEEELFWANRKNRPESLDWTTGHDLDWWCPHTPTHIPQS
jgi:hypothetical protein